MPNRRRREDSKFLAQSRLLAARMRESRARAGMTQEAVARKAEVSLNTVRNVESGQCVEPGYFTIIAMAEALEMEVDGVPLTSTRVAESLLRRAAPKGSST